MSRVCVSAVNNILYIWRIYYTNVLKQELGSAKICEFKEHGKRYIHQWHTTVKFGDFVGEEDTGLLRYTDYSNLIKDQIKSCLVPFTLRTTIELSMILTSRIIVVKPHFVKYMYCNSFIWEVWKTLFWSMEISGEIIYKFKSKCLLASSLSIYDFSNHYYFIS